MSSQRRKDASRANGALSHGPVTPEGLARCQSAPLTHGLTAHAIVLESESEDDFRALYDAYLAEFQPPSARDLFLVEQLVSARWRLDRAVYTETALLDLKMAQQEPQVEREFSACDKKTRTALAFRALCDESRAFAALDRYEARLQRAYYRALNALTAPREKKKSHKGPSPVNGHYDPPAPPPPMVPQEPAPQPDALPPAPLEPPEVEPGAHLHSCEGKHEPPASQVRVEQPGDFVPADRADQSSHHRAVLEQEWFSI